MDSWTDAAVRDLETELKRLDADEDTTRTAAEAAQAAHEAVLTEQATVRRMLEWTRARQAQQQHAQQQAAMPALEAVPVSAVLSAEAVPLNQSDLCLDRLIQLGATTVSTVSTMQVRQRLEREGIGLTQAQVRSAFKYLARKKNPPIESVSPGVWRLTGASFPNGPTAVPALNGAGGSR